MLEQSCRQHCPYRWREHAIPCLCVCVCAYSSLSSLSSSVVCPGATRARRDGLSAVPTAAELVLERALGLERELGLVLELELDLETETG